MRLTTLLATLALPLAALAEEAPAPAPAPTPAPAAVPAGPENLLPEGSFQTLDANGAPQGWSLNPGNYGASGMTFSVETEKESNLVRLSNTTTNSSCFWLSISLPLTSPNPKSLTITGQVRTKDFTIEPTPDWACAQIDGLFQKMDTTEVSHIGTTMRVRSTTDGWTTLKQTVAVPEGAEQLALQVGFWFAKGTFDVKDIKVTAE